MTKKKKPAADGTAAVDLPQTGVKYDTGKPRLSLVPPEAILAIGRVMTYGAKKYDDHYWLRGMRHTRVVDAALRHIMAWEQGIDIDDDSGFPPLWLALTELAFAVTYEALEIGEDDRRHTVIGR